MQTAPRGMCVCDLLAHRRVADAALDEGDRVGPLGVADADVVAGRVEVDVDRDHARRGGKCAVAVQRAQAVAQPQRAGARLRAELDDDVGRGDPHQVLVDAQVLGELRHLDAEVAVGRVLVRAGGPVVAQRRVGADLDRARDAVLDRDDGRILDRDRRRVAHRAMPRACTTQ